MFEDFKIVKKHFKNVKYVNLRYIYLPLTGIIEILNKLPINHIHFTPDDDVQVYDMKYGVESKDGCLILYDSNIQLSVNYKSLTLRCSLLPYKVLDEYVIFHYSKIAVELDYEEVGGHCEDYDDLNLDALENPVIVLHKKYIHKLHADSDKVHKLGFEPTEYLELNIKDMPKTEVKELEEYLSSHSLNHLHIKANFGGVQKYREDVCQAIFDNLHIKQVVVTEI